VIINQVKAGGEGQVCRKKKLQGARHQRKTQKANPPPPPPKVEKDKGGLKSARGENRVIMKEQTVGDSAGGRETKLPRREHR